MPNENIRLANLPLRLLVKRKQMGRITSETILFTHCPEQSLSLSLKSRTLRNALAKKYYSDVFLRNHKLHIVLEKSVVDVPLAMYKWRHNVTVVRYSFILPAKGKSVRH